MLEIEDISAANNLHSNSFVACDGQRRSEPSACDPDFWVDAVVVEASRSMRYRSFLGLSVLFCGLAISAISTAARLPLLVTVVVPVRQLISRSIGVA